MPPHIYTISPDRPFLATLAQGLLVYPAINSQNNTLPLETLIPIQKAVIALLASTAMSLALT